MENLAEHLDPYHRWLGIPPKHQPPNHYRLLGIEVFENDPEVIRDAAERQMGHVRRYQLGRYMELSQKILNEIAAAKTCLSDPVKKAAYDDALGQTFKPAQPAAPPQMLASVHPPIVPPPLPTTAKPPVAPTQGPPPAPKPNQAFADQPAPAEAKRPRGQRTLLIAFAVTAVGVLVGLVGLGLFSKRQPIDASPAVSTQDDNKRSVPVPETPPVSFGDSPKQTAEPGTMPAELTNSLGMKLVLIPAGEFMMGSDDGDANERPVHRVRITKPFYLGATEVTQAQYEQVMGANPSQFTGDPQRATETVSWNDAVEFCRRLSQKEGKTYALPTEAQWEYACRAGSAAQWCFGNDESSLAEYAWYEKNSQNTTQPVGRKRPNAWGLHDMHGNVWEWCADWHGSDCYGNSATDDPSGPALGSNRVHRGGGWDFPAGYCRSARRDYCAPDGRGRNCGLRVLLALPENAATGADFSTSSSASLPAQSKPELAPVPEMPPVLPSDSQKRAAERLKTPVELTNSIGIRLVLIPAGEFLMGSDDEYSNEKPVHRVRITKPFYLGVTEVTQRQYEQVMGANPSQFTGDPQRPVEQVSWTDALEFCNRLGQKEGKSYALPTEAQWEYACRAESAAKWCFGDAESSLDEYAWYRENANNTTHPVAQKRPNAWGLRDMHGNVWEWCADWYGSDYYGNATTDDPPGLSLGSYRVRRGGSWFITAGCCRSAYRIALTPEYRPDDLGLRVLLAVE